VEVTESYEGISKYCTLTYFPEEYCKRMKDLGDI